jgi:hypothetical protein
LAGTGISAASTSCPGRASGAAADGTMYIEAYRLQKLRNRFGINRRTLAIYRDDHEAANYR